MKYVGGYALFLSMNISTGEGLSARITAGARVLVVSLVNRGRLTRLVVKKCWHKRFDSSHFPPQTFYRLSTCLLDMAITPYFQTKLGTLYNGNCLSVLKELPDSSIQMCVTSPPYWGLRDYGTAKWEGGSPDCDHSPISSRKECLSSTLVGSNPNGNHAMEGWKGGVCGRCGAKRMDNQIGLEETPEQYVSKMVTVFHEVKRVLRDDGTLWLNLGDSYVGGGGASGHTVETTNCGRQTTRYGAVATGGRIPEGFKPKDLVGIPWRVAFALQADGWYLRQDIIWCLSGGTWLWVKSENGIMPMTIKDMTRLKNVSLWSGKKWVKVLGWNKNKRMGNELELVLRSGERISCSPNHRWPTTTGLKKAIDLNIGDVLTSCRLPETGKMPEYINLDTAGFIGLYLAEGSRSDDTIQFSLRNDELNLYYKIDKVAQFYGGSSTYTINGNNLSVRVYGRILNAIIDDHVSGKIAKNKCLSVKCWNYGNSFLHELLMGYLRGDGHYDVSNNRWRLGFTRNYNFERDLRAICARLNYKLTLSPSFSMIGNKKYPSFRGEIKMVMSKHFNNKNQNEITEIRKSRCRYTYDIGVEAPHTFSLASGILTHNSKPNPMPESVTDRPTKAHEYIFLLAKSQKYYYDNEAIKENSIGTKSKPRFGGNKYGDDESKYSQTKSGNEYTDDGTRNRRSVWTVTTKPFKGAHFATFPPDLIEPCIKAGSAEHTVVLDPFMGAGTTAYVCEKHNRAWIGIELSTNYCAIAVERIKPVANIERLAMSNFISMLPDEYQDEEL